jgi:hypothetical protein
MQEKIVLLLGTAVRGSATSCIAVVAMGSYTVHLQLRSVQKCHRFNQLNCDNPVINLFSWCNIVVACDHLS